LKKAITIAASSAVALIVLLGSASYLLFPQVSVQGSTATIDVFTQLSGKGTDKSGGNFNITQNDTVYIYAEVRNASNIPQGSRLVSYEIHWPASSPQNGSIYDSGTSTTNASGIAEIPSLPPHYIPVWALALQGRDPSGTWLVYATTSIDDQPLIDTLTFLVQR
jgi:hypothetical protein